MEMKLNKINMQSYYNDYNNSDYPCVASSYSVFEFYEN